MIYELAGNPPKLRPLPRWMMKVMGLVNPLMRELREMDHNWFDPYIVDHSKFGNRYWSDATSFEAGLQKTLDWYKSDA